MTSTTSKLSINATATGKGSPEKHGALGRLSKAVLGSAICALAAACGGGGETEVDTRPEIAGVAVAGPVASGTVTAYELKADGGTGRALGSTTTSATGAFRVLLESVPTAGIRLVLSGGSYASLANHAVTVAGVPLSAILPAVPGTGVSNIAITPLTTFADRRTAALMATAVPLPSALDQAEAAVRLVYGIQTSTPLYNRLPDFTLTSGDAAILALLFGAFDELAILQGRTTAEILKAIADDFADGVLDGRTGGGAAITFGNALAPASLATSTFLGALAAYLAPSNTTTIVARNGLTLNPATVYALQGGVAALVRTNWNQDGNNSALLSGPALGTATTNVDQLRKPIRVTVLGANSSLTFGQAYATRSSSTSQATYVVLPATNVGSEVLCFLNLSNLTYRDAGGTVLTSNGLTYVFGSIRTLTSIAVSTSTCLEPGKSGIFNDVSTTLNYTALAGMEFSVQTTNSASTVPAARIVPQAYTAQNNASSSSISISLKNVGTGPGRLGTRNHRWFLFDDAMVPLFWGFANDTTTPQTPLAAGGVGSISDSTVFYAGSGRRLLVFSDFSDGAVAGASPLDASECAATITTEQKTECLQEARNHQLSVQDSTARAANARAAAATASTGLEIPAAAK